ncbi:MAG: hypothetical protein L0177_02460 [Chloroflexi bacterium]|nr:hypothetical protein [Chloroflexota bacterium]
MRKLIGLARSPELFLSVYLSTSPSQITTEGVRLRLAALLDEEQKEFEGTAWEAPLRSERESVESYVQTLRPGGQGLVILSSQEAQEGRALWLPQQVEYHARFGQGAYVLPLIDVLDEFEPVGLALVERDRSRLMALAAGQIVEERRLEAEVPGMHRAGGGYATGYRASSDIREAGGGAGDIRERHILVHAERHFKEVVGSLEEMGRHHGFRRLFVAGPTETRNLFKSHLSSELSRTLAGEFSVDAHATDQELRDLALEHNREVERREEIRLVEEIVTRAEKQQGAVVGLDATLWALNRHELHLLALAGEVDWDGHYCSTCDILLPLENVLCPQCNEMTRRIALWEEIPGFALRNGVRLEVVHGEAASLLWGYDGLGGLLRFTQH